MINFHCFGIEADFYRDVEECLTVDPAAYVKFLDGTDYIYFALQKLCPQ